MNTITSKFDKVLNASPDYGHVNHEPDSSKEQQRNTPQKSMPFSDQIGNYQRNKGIPTKSYADSKIYIVGSGIAGMSAAYYFIRDGHVPAKNIVFLEQLHIDGGSLDGAGNVKDGYIIRGGREMDMTYENLWDMFQDIPALEMPAPYSVLDEYRLINDNDSNYSKARLIHNKGIIKDFSKFGLNKKDQLAIIRLLLKNKEELDDLSIQDYFSESFLNSNFWTFWRTMFAFENWHSLLELKLYMHRFLHAIDGLNDLSSLVFPKYNQYDTFVTPLRNFLKEKGVTIELNTLVKDLDIHVNTEGKVVEGIITEQDGKEVKIPVRENDYVIVTTGSMTEDTFYGDNKKAPVIGIDNSTSGQSSGWKLWKNLAAKSEVFGKPEKFCSNIEKSAWESATLTCKPSALIDKLKEYSVNDPYSGKTVTGGIITITDSNWLMSFTCNRQPHFPEQPDDILVLWVYALFMDKEGNYIKKTMPECTGDEILAELCHHLGITDQLENVQENTIVRTAFMPYITSMFMPRAKGDRPRVVPEGCKNLGLVGQFVETNNDVVFTMESSVRTARIAVYELLNLNKQVPDINPLQYDIRHLLKAAKTLNDDQPFIGEGLLRKILKGTYFEHVLPGTAKEEEEHESFVMEQINRFKDWMKGIRG
ncbi:oleate hydratase [Elizabethkingia meningoseptica]|uniref:oleate hydratase n=1 Tax=Elizabethkingia meningoseptica TaxID=238 RepID=UPI00093706FC|nr:oleate hydratase [Elizabethkingia meningoseptica]MCL1676959.1 oleate hydratase [Elizabethkingia meningoseptica]MCL1685102.1 oleate hydratase [Elizabethkingia meningoseptica]MDE5432593.1 oleate hydratase [Elizabethkingia meningoseptica]MDE5488435.1 oleate hydratase [Elizabethkingia meningoseptica]MDE5493755.1 oleate hydratase [Elizabethkingia meningoseptica]